ncbi:hypothetical protein [uncultured Hydrogenophaga sp.]|uniref:hypothetical protein n=1 Tax=uncultured Hydrogenophaga sp. TaxID=199683 RepID=UPI00265F38CF|nr:hypothetical protein [uncultured Hydrogenophaga sp.]
MTKLTTLEHFERFAGKRFVQAALRREWIVEEGTYQDFISQLYSDLDEAIYALQSSLELRQKDSEDRISQDILIGLSQKGYQATHDTKTGGHVDLSIRLGDHSWIGEAKKDGNFSEGFLQLATRYVQASGNFAHDQGGLLFYLVQTPDALGKLSGWRAKLTAEGNTCFDCTKNRLAFFSTHKLEGPGTDFTVRTMAVSLYHKPKDKSARNSAAKKAAKTKS